MLKLKTKTMKRFASVLVLSLAAACGGSSKPAATPAPEAEATTAVAPETEAAPAAVAGDPEAKLTEAQCNEALDHATMLMKDDAQAKAYVEKMVEAHDQLLAQCLEKAQQKDYDCLMAAKTFAELGGCEQPE
jgi:hypothetical protein